MTATHDPADAIEQAESAIVYEGMRVDWEWDDMPHQVARALHDAGLLTDPADRDEQYVDLTPVANIIRDAQAYRGDAGIVFKPESAASDLFAAGWLAGRSERLARERAEAEVKRITLSYAENNRAWEKYRERAEAENAELRATVDRVRALADAHTGTHDLDCKCNDWSLISPNEVRAALDGAGESE